MDDTDSISWGGMAALYALMLLPLAIGAIWKLRLNRDLCWTLLRMSAQLLLVGYYLEYLFQWNQPFLNFAWLAVMLAVASGTAVKRIGLDWKKFYAVQVCSLLCGMLPVLLYILFAVLRRACWYNAADMIPIGGMILGNAMRGNVVAMERFFSSLHDRHREYTAMLLLGATLREAARPFAVEALRAALSPHLATMATVGIVSLPGMMTGQILGGSSPMTAIAYQIVIMASIFAAMQLSALAGVYGSIRYAFAANGEIQPWIKKRSAKSK